MHPCQHQGCKSKVIVKTHEPGWRLKTLNFLELHKVDVFSTRRPSHFGKLYTFAIAFFFRFNFPWSLSKSIMSRIHICFVFSHADFHIDKIHCSQHFCQFSSYIISFSPRCRCHYKKQNHQIYTVFHGTHVRVILTSVPPLQSTIYQTLVIPFFQLKLQKKN